MAEESANEKDRARFLRRPLGYSTVGHLMGCLTLILIAALIMVTLAFVLAHYG
jgi:hypothetical protein